MPLLFSEDEESVHDIMTGTACEQLILSHHSIISYKRQ